MVYAACFRNEGIVISLYPNIHGCQRDRVAASALSDDKEIIRSTLRLLHLHMMKIASVSR